jgi:hypothetical protein
MYCGAVGVSNLEFFDIYWLWTEPRNVFLVQISVSIYGFTCSVRLFFDGMSHMLLGWATVFDSAFDVFQGLGPEWNDLYQVLATCDFVLGCLLPNWQQGRHVRRVKKILVAQESRRQNGNVVKCGGVRRIWILNFYLDCLGAVFSRGSINSVSEIFQNKVYILIFFRLGKNNFWEFSVICIILFLFFILCFSSIGNRNLLTYFFPYVYQPCHGAKVKEPQPTTNVFGGLVT